VRYPWTLGQTRPWPPRLVVPLGLVADLLGAVLGRQQAQTTLAWHLAFERLIEAADRLGMRPSTLRNRMRKLDIQRPTAG
jgi:hypothetical protein